MIVILLITSIRAQESETLDIKAVEIESNSDKEVKSEDMPLDEEVGADALTSAEMSTDGPPDGTTISLSDITTEDVFTEMSSHSSEIPVIQETEETKESDNSESSESIAATDSALGITSEYNGLDNQLSVSTSNFSCYGRSFGQYADVDKDCRMFHLCYPFFNESTDELIYQRISFLCDDESVFDQKRFICVHNSSVDHMCSDSPLLYERTNQEYLIKVFSQNVSPIDEVKGHEVEADEQSPSWFNWFWNN